MAGGSPLRVNGCLAKGQTLCVRFCLFWGHLDREIGHLGTLSARNPLYPSNYLGRVFKIFVFTIPCTSYFQNMKTSRILQMRRACMLTRIPPSQKCMI